MKIPSLQTKEDKIAYLVANKNFILDAKKSQIKYADAIDAPLSFLLDGKDTTDKAEILTDVTNIKVKAVINTTNLVDSHMDLHLKGIWNKSLKENKSPYLLKMHRMDFDSVISERVKASVAEYDFKDLGFDYEGKTQALIFDAEIDKSDSAGMFEWYAKNRVKQHSVGMRYVKIQLAVSDPRYKEENEVWEKYYPEIANKDAVDSEGYFYAVTEAKFIEGSAVLRGSNFVTPTLEVEPLKSTPNNEPSLDTQITQVKEFINLLKF